MKKLTYILFLFSAVALAQHHSKMTVMVNSENKTLVVTQELIFFNQTQDTLKEIVLNDWMNGYTSKNTPLAARFSDEFERGFHLAKEKDRGRTENLSILDENKSILVWTRNAEHPDVIVLSLTAPVLPNQKVTLHLQYTVKIPNNRFTKYGYGDNGKMYLKNWFLTPARYDNHAFVSYDNLNLDDIPNSLSDYELVVNVPANLTLSSDLTEIQKTEDGTQNTYYLSGKNRLDINLFVSNTNDFSAYKNGTVEVVTDIKSSRLNDIQKAILIDKIVSFTAEHLGKYPHSKIAVAEADYERNPFYGLNQLPVFMSPFTDEFLYEIRFLKTYLNNYLHATLQLDPRKDNWVYDSIQIYLMMKYMDEFHPDSKMMGGVAKLGLIRGYNMVSLRFNGQYAYFYMLMARKNLDQPLNSTKDVLVKFNEKIASKYKAGLSLKYLDRYLENDIVPNSLRQFLILNQTQQTDNKDFETILTANSPKKIDWFFDELVASRHIFDYKFEHVSRTKDSIQFSLKNKTKTNVPIPVYGIKDKKIVFKKWIDPIAQDSIFSVPRNDAEKIVINYENEAPEFNLRNNWRSLSSFHLNNRPIKFNFLKDLEDPRYNQILYLPTLEYNLYDGFLPGFRLHNKTILDKPFIYDINPTLSTKTQNLSGKASFYFNQYNRDSRLYYIRYMMGGHYLHYAPDAYYSKIAPTVFMYFRPKDWRDNRKEMIIIKDVMVDKQKSAFTTSADTQTYQVFNAKYLNSKTEIRGHFSFLGDFQYSKTFSKLVAETQYRRLFDDNRQLNLRLFAGTFLHHKAEDSYFDFGLDRPTDYLFESEYLGRSETKGLFSQQLIMSDGFFKSMLETRTANRWLVTTNASYSIWNWIDAFGDIGMMKNRGTAAKFIYDSGIRLNLVADYFEVFLPVYSNNGWEVGDKNYGEKIRFIVTFRPETLINLFTRKWF